MPDEEARKIHNSWRSQERRNEAKYQRDRAMRLGILQSFDAYEDHILRTRSVLNATLQLWFGVPLFCAEDGKAAALLYSDLEGPLIHLGPGRQGKSEAKGILDTLDTAAAAISKSNLRRDGPLPPEVVEGVEHLLKNLPFPQSLLFIDSQFRETPPDVALSALADIREILARQIEAQPKGNARAYRTALALRAAYEHYTGKQITVGKDEKGKPTGAFCHCLEEVFEIVGLQPSVVALASKAQRCPDTDELLMRYRAYFAQPIGRVGHHAMLFTKVGWVENMTFREKLRNLMAMKFPKLEYLHCHNICSNGRVYTTTPTKSLMSSRLVESVHNGATAALARLF